jgi:hypothetical protein
MVLGSKNSNQGVLGSFIGTLPAWWMVLQWVNALLVASLLQGSLLNQVNKGRYSAMGTLGCCRLPPLLCQASVHRPSRHHIDGGDGLDP